VIAIRRSIALALAASAFASAAAAQVTTPPTLPPAPTLTLPTTWRVTLPNGLTIVGAEMREVPLVRATLLIAGGARLDGDRPGIASMTADLLDEGAAGRDAIGLAEDVAFLGASLSTGVVSQSPRGGGG
jgi:zinc protease